MWTSALLLVHSTSSLKIFEFDQVPQRQSLVLTIIWWNWGMQLHAWWMTMWAIVCGFYGTKWMEYGLKNMSSKLEITLMYVNWPSSSLIGCGNYVFLGLWINGYIFICKYSYCTIVMLFLWCQEYIRSLKWWHYLLAQRMENRDIFKIYFLMQRV